MKKQTKPEERIVITFQDIKIILQKIKGKILVCMVIMGMLGALFALTRPIKYKAEGSFRERNTKPSGISDSLVHAIIMDSASGGNSNSELATMIRSHKLMKEVAQKLSLQGKIEPKDNQEGVFSLIQNNLKVEWAKFRKNPYPVLTDPCCPIGIKQLSYAGEVPLYLEVLMKDKGAFQILDSKGQELAIGQLDLPVQVDKLTIILTQTAPGTSSGKTFDLSVAPMKDTVQTLIEDLEFDSAKNDKGVLKMVYSHRDRHLGTKFVNTIMDVFQKYLKEYQAKVSAIQMDYLYQKQELSTEKLKKIMEDNAMFASNDLTHSGFVNAKDEMEFLAQRRHELREKLLANELQMRRLNLIQPGNCAYFDQCTRMEGDSTVLNDMLSNIRKLKQEREGIELAIQQGEIVDEKALNGAFQQQITDLEQVQRYKGELEQIIHGIVSKQSLEPSYTIMKDSRFLITGWFEKVAQSSSDLKQKAQESFVLYLTNLQRMLNMYEKVLQERLTFQYQPSTVYQGIDLAMAKELYMDFCKQLNEDESTIRKTHYFLNQMHKEDFEITSLSPVLTDSVSLGMISKASDLVLRLKDEDNQSQREQERLKTELALQKTFLSQHLKQTIELLELNKQLMNEKIYALQNVKLELINQQVSVLEKNLYDHVQSRLADLEQERVVMTQHLDDLYTQMTGLPKKQMNEQLIDHQIQINQLIIEEIARITESKNISNNLELIQSAPLDPAIAAVHPIPPKAFLFTLLGAAFGGLLGCGFFVGAALVKGLSVSAANLKAIGQHVSGNFSVGYTPSSETALADADLDTLRRLEAFFDSLNNTVNPECRVLLLIEGKGPDYSPDLAKLLLQKGRKVLIVDTGFSGMSQPKTGFVQYLQGKEAELPISKMPFGDYLAAGTITRYTSEILASQPFGTLLAKLKSSYDWILLVSHASPVSAEAESLAALFPLIAVSVHDEMVENLEFFITRAEEEKNRVSFVLYNV